MEIYRTGDVTLHQGECLEILRGIPAGSIDALVTDPPYSVTSEASSSVSRSRRGVREIQFFEAWLREHLAEFSRVLRSDGVLFMTIDWRGAMALDQACSRLNIREPKIGVWDKDRIGMGGILRNSYECFAVVPMRDWKRKRADVADVWRIRWTQGGRDSDHPAEKPVELMRRACQTFVRPGGVVLDPFMGSGATGVAAILEGCSFIGIEREQENLEVAKARIDNLERQGNLIE